MTLARTLLLATAAILPASLALAGEITPPPSPLVPGSVGPPTGVGPDAEGLPGRQRPGVPETFPAPVVQINPDAVTAPAPDAFPTDQLPIPDRWRLAADLKLVNPRWFDPYNQNTLKGDRPIKGTKDWFLSVNLISDSVLEPRSVPTPINQQSIAHPGSLDPFGRTDSVAASQTFITGFSLFKGSTAFKPPDLSFNTAVAFNFNYTTSRERGVLSVNSTRPGVRRDAFVGLQEAFVEYHLRDTSTRYDFDAIRVGIQPFSADFRGFLFQDNQLGVRLFGDRDDNRLQYNLAIFRRIDKEANSGLNDLTRPIRKDYIAIGNLYRQDFPVPGFTSQVTAIYNANREGGDVVFNSNGFPVIPALIGSDRARNYDVLYLGYNGDGHIGRINLTASAYAAMGKDHNNIFTNQPADIRSWFVAVEPSYDLDWVRIRLSALYASGDKRPHDNVETGFDAILENPQFAGADTSFFIRQSIPFIGGGLVGLTGPNGVLIDLRSSKDEGQSNFNNPGTVLLGIGADFDVTPQVRVSSNINHIAMADTAVVEALRQQGAISKNLGWDYSVATIWRPWMTQNIVFRGSAAVFQPSRGFNNLFAPAGRNNAFYSILFNAVLSY
jgi:hypothetical protein